MSDQQEHHEYQPKGLYIPLHIVDLVESEEITVKEAYLLALIDALVKRRGIGCFASNTWLSKKIQTKPRQLQTYLDRLIAKKLVIVVTKSDGTFGSRVLETAWSRVGETIISYTPTSAENCMTPHAENCMTPHAENCAHINTENDKYREHTVAAARTTESASLQSLNGTVEKESDALSLAKRLHRLLLTKRKIMREIKNIHTWVKYFAELLDKRSLAQVEKALSWYEKHIGENQWIPQLYSASSFLTEFARLEDAMDRYKEQEKKSSDYGTSSNPIPFTTITLLKGGGTRSSANPDLDWDLIHRIAKQRKCEIENLSGCYLLDPNNGEDPITIDHLSKLSTAMKKMGWTYPK